MEQTVISEMKAGLHSSRLGLGFLTASGRSIRLKIDTEYFKDFKFVPLMFVTLGFGPQILLSRAIFHGSGTQAHKPKRTTPKGAKENSLSIQEAPGPSPFLTRNLFLLMIPKGPRTQIEGFYAQIREF